MKNGRCDRHGGKTPSGRDWHTVVWPDCSTPAGALKFERKLRQQKRYAAKRAERLSAMSTDQMTKYFAWQRTHPPGSKAARGAKRDRARQNAETMRLLSSGASQRPTDPEAARIATALSAAKARLATLEARNAVPSTDNDDDGVFS
jgi:hypothetical protein